MTSQLRQLARKLFLKYSSALRQTSQTLSSAKKTRQHDVDKFMELDELDKFALLSSGKYANTTLKIQRN